MLLGKSDHRKLLAKLTTASFAEAAYKRNTRLSGLNRFLDFYEAFDARADRPKCTGNEV